jgi:hypothetical protein
MRIEDLLPCSAEALNKLTDAELEEGLRHYFPITRPEMAATKAKSPATVPKQKSFEDLEKEAKIKKAKEIARSLGINI